MGSDMIHSPPIVVGVDGSDASASALEYAMREAQLRGSPIRAVICRPLTVHRDDSKPENCLTHTQAVELLEHLLTDLQQRHPHPVPIIRDIVQNQAGPALVAASRNAELIVLGSRLRGPHHHSRHGPTIEHCIAYSESPILIVPWKATPLDQQDIDIDLHQATSSL